MTIKRAKVKMLKAKAAEEGKTKETRKERKVITGAKAKTRKAQVWQRATLVESLDILSEIVGGIFDR